MVAGRPHGRVCGLYLISVVERVIHEPRDERGFPH